VEQLSVTVTSGGAARPLLEDVSFDLPAGGSLGVVGRSGAGKSTLGSALLGLVPRRGRFGEASRILIGDVDITRLRGEPLRALRGRHIAMVFQEPLLALDPAMRVGEQLAEAVRAHGLADAAEADARAEAMLARVGIPRPATAAGAYPHEFSGGMRQRLLIAAALLLDPDVLVADEPTTALDPTLQAQVLDLIDTLRAASGTSLVMISHDLAVVGERCEQVLVLDEGRIVRRGSARNIIGVPALDGPDVEDALVPDAEVLLDVRDLRVHYVPRRAWPAPPAPPARAVDGVSFSLRRGEALGLVGESGCGKTTLAHAILRITAPTAGTVHLGGTDLLALRGEALRRMRRRIQLVPQDAGASLTPHLTAAALVAEALEVHGIAQGAAALGRARDLLLELGLPPRIADARADTLSTGERQRVAITRAIAVGPDVLICDEPVAAVDAPARAQLLDLLDALRREHGLALLFISHDLAAVRRVAARVAVMYLGRLVETGPASVITAAPRMPYTRALLAAIPTGDPAARAIRTALAGEVPSPAHPPDGCAFQTRCPHPQRDTQCTTEAPPLTPRAPGHDVACWKV
jgi:peptide/nickel transport system ATP-binding protein